MTTAGTWYPPALGTGQLLSNPPFMDTPNRDDQHGGMELVGDVSQYLKGVMRSSGRNWHRLRPGHQEALDMIAHKIARILSGADPHDPQHWEDVAGYAQAAMRGRKV
jgi:hypothetical protein